MKLTLIAVAVSAAALVASEGARPRNRAADRRLMASLSIALAHTLGRFALDVSFEAPAGITALFGRSGAGKTTVVNAIGGLLRPDRGRIALGDHMLVDTAARIFVPRHRRRIGMVFQEGRLFPHMTVRQNLLFGRRFAPRADPGANEDRVVDLLGIEPLLARHPAGLSGGETQRVAIGRGAAGEAAPAADGRAAVGARRGSQGRDPPLHRATA